MWCFKLCTAISTMELCTFLLSVDDLDLISRSLCIWKVNCLYFLGKFLSDQVQTVYSCYVYGQDHTLTVNCFWWIWHVEGNNLHLPDSTTLTGVFNFCVRSTPLWGRLPRVMLLMCEELLTYFYVIGDIFIIQHYVLLDLSICMNMYRAKQAKIM